MKDIPKIIVLSALAILAIACWFIVFGFITNEIVFVAQFCAALVCLYGLYRVVLDAIDVINNFDNDNMTLS